MARMHYNRDHMFEKYVTTDAQDAVAQDRRIEMLNSVVSPIQPPEYSKDYAIPASIVIQKPVFHVEEAHEQVLKPVFTTVDAYQVIEKPIFKVKEVIQHIEKPVYDEIITQYGRLASDIEHLRLNIPHLPSVKYIEHVPVWVWPLIASLLTAAITGWIR